MSAHPTSALELTRELTRLRSINPPGGEQACADHLAGIPGPPGLEVAAYSFAEGRTSLVARLEGPHNAAPLCFTGHLDTVPLGAAAWKLDPRAQHRNRRRWCGGRVAGGRRPIQSLRL